MAYHDLGATQYEQRYRSRVIGNLRRHAKAFGFSLQEVSSVVQFSALLRNLRCPLTGGMRVPMMPPVCTDMISPVVPG
jgi:hypothetical protein